jgi:hypothetical protein
VRSSGGRSGDEDAEEAKKIRPSAMAGDDQTAASVSKCHFAVPGVVLTA